MSRPVLVGLLVAAVLALAGGTAAFITVANQPKCGDQVAVSDAPAGNAAGPTAASPTEEYWTEERMRNAKPAPMPQVESC